MRSLKSVGISRTLLVIALLTAITFSSVAAYFFFPFRATSFSRVGPNRAAIVDALSDLDPNPLFQNETAQYLTAAGLSVDIYMARQVTVEFMKSFPVGYRLVVFRTHSATSRHGVFYFTSEPYDESRYEPEQFRDELRPGRDYQGNPPVFAFGSRFVDTFLEQRFRDAIVVGMGCFSAGTSYGTEEEVTIRNVQVEKRPNLADAFYHQGAVATVGWDSLVTLKFSDMATVRLVKALTVEALTIRQATDTVNLVMGPDPIYGSSLTFYPEWNGDIGLLGTSHRPSMGANASAPALVCLRGYQHNFRETQEAQGSPED